jgi:hypothetical protein
VVKPGEKYRHYKNNEVFVTAVCKAPVDSREGGKAASWIDAIATDNIEAGEMIVIYQELNKPGAWARPLRIFEEVLGNGTTKYYRFEKIS